ncbi:Panacea domain-containing protein [Methanolapillus millepedarum]|uniref:Antitoxin SocA-like Panacea domain-containing protein n=1 Tax=Methanolapillus millepedarum TaxID=3028296 RepID=A0AA96V667_9EURY|nr:hypothetical protein MsAc7_17930 [Methanosarcinaceae archaeon Ac7]
MTPHGEEIVPVQARAGSDLDVDIFDVANWFLSKDSLQHKKLQKLCYYAVAWSYALLERPVCKNDLFEAWVHGPVNSDLFTKYRTNGWLPIQKLSQAAASKFDPLSEEVLEFVWESYGDLTQFQLENLSHSEIPWQKARGGIPETERSNEIINPEDMKRFYRELFEENQND